LLFLQKMNKQPIGVFDSGYGGLTILKEMVKLLPGYDFVYLGDNARSPYGPRPFDQVYEYSLQAVQWFFKQGCPLVILACNTASAKALRTIQQNDLPLLDKNKRVLGVIRPTAEVIGKYTASGHVGVLGTKGTVQSGSYIIEIEKFFPAIKVTQEACPMWVPLIENNEMDNAGTDYFVQRHINQLLAGDSKIDTILLGCTHYPLLAHKIKQFVPPGIAIIDQGVIVAKSLQHYLERHAEIDARCTKNGEIAFYTTGHTPDFDVHAADFFGEPVKSMHLQLH
jgi:glutamate racemase